MDATMFDGTTTTALTPDLAATDEQRGYTWYDIDVSDAGSEPAARQLLQALAVPAAVQDLLLKPNRSAKVHLHATEVEAVVWMGGDVDGAPPPEVHLSWSPERLISVRWGGDAAMQTVRQALADRAERLFSKPTSVLGVVLLLMNTTVDSRLRHLDLALYQIDDEILQGVGKSPLARLRAVRAEASALALRYSGLADATANFSVDTAALPGMSPDDVTRMQTYATHVTDTYHHVSELGEGARGTVQDYQTAVGDKQGDRINQLTIVSVLFLPISFLTGYFGMNFDWLDDNLESDTTFLLFGVVLPFVVLLASLLALQRFGYLARRRAPRPSADAAIAAGPTSPAADPAGPAARPPAGSGV